ncbi:MULTISPECIES: lipopolysaccharide kinase InaA family protein [Bacteroides]|uniref:lipopolysaccharide kinase InaA family protein n=1 Tax=Bacteroides TaxID=816 RepID=UPI001D269FC7|nr:MULTISPECIES: lipopolysaccharide kinase InaA family protein [Bacteroides]HJD92657.1 tyrosine protein kinase [Bacteroides coprosuis]
MYKRLINPKYIHLTSFLEKLPDVFETSGETIYTGRNLIKVFEVEGLTVNVKRYGVPLLINRFAYTFFRKPKGFRAYTYPYILAERGINTPEPIAYMEERSMGLIKYSYFVSIQSPYKSFLYEIGNMEVDEIKEFTKAFALFTSDMHKKDVYHKDYSPGNILCGKKDGEYDFCLVDINRMEFGPVNVEKGCANFARLWGQPSFFRYLAKVYADDRDADVNECIEWVMHYRKKFWKYYSGKYKVRYNLKFD